MKRDFARILPILEMLKDRDLRALAEHHRQLLALESESAQLRNEVARQGQEAAENPAAGAALHGWRHWALKRQAALNAEQARHTAREEALRRDFARALGRYQVVSKLAGRKPRL